MSWIILALTLGASITSLIHGVFMLFGSLSITGAAIPGIPSTMLATLPVISAICALIGGIIAFNQSKWGALFLFIAVGLCAATRDTWLYAGIYFFAAVFCFLLRPKDHNDYDYIYEDEDYDEDDENDSPYLSQEGRDFYYSDEPPAEINTPPGERHSPFRKISLEHSDDDIGLQLNIEPPKVRRRVSKSCPECGAIVSREESICPNCGAKLFVASDDNITPEPLMPVTPLDEDIIMPTVSEHLASPVNINEEPESTERIINLEKFSENNEDESGNENESEIGNEKFSISSIISSNDEINLNTKEDDEDMGTSQTVSPAYRVTKPKRIEDDYEPQRVNMKRGRPRSINSDIASTYQENARTKSIARGKKRKRSAGRKFLSMLLLVAAVGGALYFLLGLRKLPPGDLPPMARNEITSVSSGTSEQETRINVSTGTAVDENVAEPVEVAVTANELPDFVPDREPKSGLIIGSNVNVRADHSTSSTRITRLNVGSRVEITGSFNVPTGRYSGIWYSVRTGNNDGWIYGRYVQPVGSGLPSGYSNALLKSFGANLTELVEAFGQPSRKTSSSAEWKDIGLTATLRGEDITRIRLTNPNRDLQNGLKVGMSQTALLQIMGYPSSVNNKVMNYNENGKTGLAVQLDKNNAISSITVNEIQ